MGNNYSFEVQKLFLSIIITSPTLYTRCQNILESKYWTFDLRSTAKFIFEYIQKYNKLPTPELIYAHDNVKIERLSDSDLSALSDWFLENIESFCRHKAMEILIKDAVDSLLDKNEYGEIERRCKEAMMISLQKDLGTNYFSNPLERLERMKERMDMTSTGWKSIDEKLYGGFNRGELTIYAAGSGCVSGDTKVTVKKENTTSIEVDIETLKNNYHGYYVDSPDGYIEVVDCVEKYKKMLEFIMDSGNKIKISVDHLFQTPELAWIYARDYRIGDTILSNTGHETIVEINEIEDSVVYDLSVNHDNHRYYTNGLVSHNTGKSVILQNQAINWVNQGLSVLYVTLELSEELCGLRTDAIVTEETTKYIFGHMDDIAKRLLFLKRNSPVEKGDYQIKKFPEGGTTVNDIKAYIKEYEIQTNKKFDAICVDYLDILYPTSSKVDINSTFLKDKMVTEELRAMAQELGLFMCTASQLNRSSIEEGDFNQSHIAGGISKINTADNVIALFAPPAMKEQGRFQIQFLKTRSSNGVGQRVELKYDNNCMRLSDLDEYDKIDSNVEKIKDTIKEEEVPKQKPVNNMTAMERLKKVQQRKR